MPVKKKPSGHVSSAVPTRIRAPKVATRHADTATPPVAAGKRRLIEAGLRLAARGRGLSSLGLRELEYVAVSLVGIGGLAPRLGRLAEITAQFGVLTQSVECDEPGRLFSLRPELNSPVHGTRGVTVRV